MNDLTDEQLMLMFQYGDLEAFSLLFTKYQQPLWRYLFHLCRNVHTAEDLLQEVFIKIAKSASSYRSEGKLCSWFYRIATNHYLNYKKSRSYQDQGNVVSISELLPNNFANDKQESSPSDIAEKNEFREILAVKIASLPERLQEVYILYEMEQKTYEEIGDILQIPVGTVKTHLHRARQQLMEIMKKYWRK